ncbi:type I secretion system permease/ATPase, partial [Thalassobaculum sp.]
MQSRGPVTVHRLLRACYTAFAACGVFSFFVNLLMLTMPLFMYQVFDRVLASRSPATLFLLLLMATLALGVQAALDSVRAFAFVRVSRWIDRRIAPLLLSAIVIDALDRSKVGSIQVLRQLAVLRSFLTGPGMLTMLDIPWVPVFLLIIFYVNAPMGLAALGGAAVMLVLGIVNDRVTRPALAEAQGHSATAFQSADSAVRNAAVVESMGMRQAILRRYHVANDKVLDLQGKASDRAAVFLAISKSARMLVQMVIMSVSVVQIIDPQTPMTPGLMIAAVLILGRALQPIEQGVGQARPMIEAYQAYRQIEEVLEAAQSRLEKMELPPPAGHLSVENLYFQPPGLTKPILQRITFEVAAGEALGVIGPSASGKSTLARLLVGVAKPNIGNVRLDGADVFSWDGEELGRHLGFMPQDIELFPGTVAENIARLEDEPDPQKVVKAARLAGLHDMILRLPNGYDTEIGWAGQILSGGQKQRVALARALYGDPRVVVLDEPNANLDSQGDDALINAVRALKANGVTVVLITHRPQTLSLMDKVLVLQNGTVQRFGPRDEVMPALPPLPPRPAVAGPGGQAVAGPGGAPDAGGPAPRLQAG